LHYYQRGVEYLQRYELPGLYQSEKVDAIFDFILGKDASAPAAGKSFGGFYRVSPEEAEQRIAAALAAAAPVSEQTVADLRRISRHMQG